MTKKSYKAGRREGGYGTYVAGHTSFFSFFAFFVFFFFLSSHS